MSGGSRISESDGSFAEREDFLRSWLSEVRFDEDRYVEVQDYKPVNL